MSFNPETFHNLTISLQIDHLANPSINFLYNSLEEVNSFKLLGLTLSHDLSWVNNISKLAAKVLKYHAIYET